MPVTLTFIFWVDFLSPHIAPLCYALSSLPCTVVKVVCLRDCDEDRIRQGWSFPPARESFGIELISFRKASSAFELNSADMRYVSIFQGVRTSASYAPYVNEAFVRGHLLFFYQEQLDHRGVFGLLRYLYYRFFVIPRKPANSFYLLIGGESNRRFRQLFAASRRLSFIYFSSVAESAALHESDIDTNSDRRDPSKIVYIGQLIPRKGVDLLLRAVPLLAAKSAHISIYGLGPMVRQVRNYCEKYDSITYHGPIPMHSVSNVMKSSRILVAPSRYDGWCSVVPEAILCGTRIITTNTTGASYLVKSMNIGLVLDCASLTPGVLAKAIDSELVSGPNPDARTNHLRYEALSAQLGASYLRKCGDILSALGPSAGAPSCDIPPWHQVS